MDSNSAIAVYHFFTVICFFMPLLGAVLSDGYIGLYRTILYLSIAYICGDVILTISRYFSQLFKIRHSNNFINLF